MTNKDELYLYEMTASVAIVLEQCPEKKLFHQFKCAEYAPNFEEAQKKLRKNTGYNETIMPTISIERISPADICNHESAN
jgi:hypothetical protein